jgi:hypothetical protein
MSSESRRRFAFDPLKSPSDAFMDYLEGYASAFDFYSVCSRPIAPNIHSLVDEFWRATQDFSHEAAAASSPQPAQLEDNTDGEQLRPARQRASGR